MAPSAERWLAEALFDPLCVLSGQDDAIRWMNPAFVHRFSSRRAKRLVDAVGQPLSSALEPVIAETPRGWTEIASTTSSGEPVVFSAHCERREDERWLLLRDNSSEARLHESYRVTVARERDRQRELELEVARRIREHEDDLAQFAEIAQVGPEVVIGFLAEAQEQVAQVEALLKGAATSAALTPHDAVELMRALHTLKGNAKSMGLNLLGARAHDAESLLLPLRQGAPVAPAKLAAALELVTDLYRLIRRAADLHQKLGSGDSAALPARTEALMRLCDELEAALAGPVERLKASLEPSLAAADRTPAVPVLELLRRASDIATSVAKSESKEVAVQVEVRNEAALRRRPARVLESAYGHLVRNAVAHGIAAPSARVSAGKPRTGLISLWCAVRPNGGLELGVRDDGDGIRPQRVLEVAKARGLMEADRASISLDEAIALITSPGFSTAEVVTTTSGRGVGLDAVKELVASLRGELHIESPPGAGAVMALRAPAAVLASNG